jgi:hypothetical protein
MSREGMVHALKQIRRVLKPDGVLADLRPDRFSDPDEPQPRLPSVCWASGGRELPAGVLEKATENLRRHRTATRELHQAIREGLFVLESTETYPFRFHFRTQEIFETFLRTGWKQTTLGAPARHRLQALRRAHPKGRIVVIEPFRLNILKKQGGG